MYSENYHARYEYNAVSSSKGLKSIEFCYESTRSLPQRYLASSTSLRLKLALGCPNPPLSPPSSWSLPVSLHEAQTGCLAPGQERHEATVFGTPFSCRAAIVKFPRWDMIGPHHGTFNFRFGRIAAERVRSSIDRFWL